MKPEKVKSRWRRSSELETGGKSTVSMGVDIEKSLSMKEKCLTTSEMKKDANIETDNVGAIGDVKMNMPHYDSLNENMYLFERKRTKRKKEVRRMLCDCSHSEEDRLQGVPGCQDECLNRLLMIECGSRCPTGEACSNKRFQKSLYAKVEPFKTVKKGWGLKLLEDVQMGNFVIEYVGEVLNTQEFKQRVKQYAREKSNHYYFMALKSDEVIDATNKGNLSRFMNHSCDPNCVTQKWTVNGELRIGFFARRDLKAGEELTFDYQFQRYGREAQKCHCQSEVCSGYIGVSNQISLDVNTNKSSNKRKKTSEEKKEDLEDLILEEEIEKLSENGGLRNKEETLLLSRLMVRAEDFHSREKLLNILLGTTEIGCLRLFLDYHGLSLLWSWMVDLTELKLRTKILQVLSTLPVPNKTMLLDSKVYNVVEQWAAMQSTLLVVDTEQSFSNTCDKKLKKTGDTSDSDTPITSDFEENCIVNDNADISCRSDDESGDVPDEDNHFNNGEFSALANNLLLSWKELKEEFRIPRRGPPKQHSKEYSHNEKKERNVCRSCYVLDVPFCTHFSRFMKDKDLSRNKSKLSFIDSEDKPRKARLATSQALTKEERRELFARTVEQQERRKKALQEQQFVNPANINSNVYQYHNSEYCINETNYSTNANSKNYSFTEPTNGNSFESYYYNTNAPHLNQPVLIPNSVSENSINTRPHSAPESVNLYEQTVLYQPSHSQVPFVGTPLPSISHQTSVMLPDSNNLAPSAITGIRTLTTPPLVPTIPVINGDLCVPSSTIIHPSLYTSEHNLPTNPCHESYSASPLTTQYISSKDQYINGQSETYYAHAHYPAHQLPSQVPVGQPLSYPESNGVLAIKAVAAILPPNWKTATDAEGNIYYYHIITRQTQWDPPELEPAEDPDEDTPTYDEPKEHKQSEKYSRRTHKKHPKKRSTTTAAADTSSSTQVTQEVAKKIKELFRTKMSTFVVQCLNPYHRDDCRVGKVTSNEDFKHLARKLTHFVMAKELKHCKNVEDLECNENVKHKARDFIHKYMARCGPYYKKDKYESLYVY